jgi:hypothetical protein
VVVVAAAAAERRRISSMSSTRCPPATARTSDKAPPGYHLSLIVQLYVCIKSKHLSVKINQNIYLFIVFERHFTFICTGRWF